MISVTRVEPLEGHWLRLNFSDGSVKDTGFFYHCGAFGPAAARACLPPLEEPRYGYLYYQPWWRNRCNR